MKKTCTKCKELKDLDCFYKRKKHKDGLRYICKQCSYVISRKYTRTRHGKIMVMYSAAKARCRSKDAYKDREVEMSISEFTEFVKTTEYYKIFNTWVDSGYKKMLSPSIDRIDNDKGYTINNIQIIPLIDNIKKDIGKSWHGGRKGKLKNSDIIRIRKLYGEQEYTQENLAKEFGVAQSTIHCIVTRKLWKNI